MSVNLEPIEKECLYCDKLATHSLTIKKHFRRTTANVCLKCGKGRFKEAMII